MKKLTTYLPVLLMLLSCADSMDSSSVQFRGSLRQMMHKGETTTQVSLDSLEHSNLYALGAASGLKGELMVMNGQPLHSQVRDSQVVMNSALEEACLLVYTYVDAWEDTSVEKELSMNELQTFLRFHAARNKLSNPFVFKLKGTVNSLNWHVIQWDPNDPVHTHEKHRNAGLKGVIEQEAVEILGFYSENHQGVFTHHDSYLHMHVYHPQRQFSGHVDALMTGPDMKLFLAKEMKEAK